MKQFVIVQHTYSEFLGQIERQLEKRDIGFFYFRPFVGQGLPASASQYDALFLLGGKVPVSDPAVAPWIEEERRLIEVFRRARRPVVGIGFGAMLIAQAFGAELSPEPFHDAYWTQARATEAGRDDPLAQAIDGRPLLVMVNGSASLPPGIAPLVVDDRGRWLAIRPDPLVYGLRFRPELKPGMIEDIMMESKRSVPDDIGEVLARARAEWPAMQQTTDRVIVALVKALDLMTERHKMPVFHIEAGDPSPGR